MIWLPAPGMEMGRPQQTPLASPSNVDAGNRSGVRQAWWPHGQAALLHATLGPIKSRRPPPLRP
jgi:hypothetical protein